MSLSIYDVGNWTAQTTYNKYDVYRYNGFYYTSIQKHNSGSTFNPDYSDGVISYNGVNKPYFFFKPSYNVNINIKPNIKVVQFGDGFRQISPNGLNSILLPIDLTFDKRTDAEARAILHFLTEKGGSKSFIFIPPFPYNVSKIFTCEEFNHVQVFANNHTIQAKFIESVV
jgi:phage-related protein